MADPVLWSLEEAGRQLGDVSTRTVRRMVERGELSAVRVGRRITVPAEAVRAWVERNMDATHNRSRAGSDVREASTCRESAKRETRTVSTGARTRRNGGRATPTQAASELAEALGLPTDGRQKHS
ncbi:MAG: helix-turn-helix domain-containing protein [Spiribacter salinus]|uniref:Helix-turn-helix domain-containing protein n=1 Tax=Spiribacter salinus TaxID=1335746 RepID=A0A540VTX3_9GAMM|nr:MAG: helix-turn-helix domain-containing protein [Spiribacter salinus]